MDEELRQNLKKIGAEFLIDQEGVIIKIALKSDFVFRAVLVYDGKNHAILGRNNKDFYLLKSIDPFIRKKLIQDKNASIVETTDGEIHQAYHISVYLVDDIGLDDTYIEDYQKYFAKLEKMYGTDRVQKFKQHARNILRQLFHD